MTLFLAEQIALLQIARTLVAVLDEIVEDITEDPNQIINDGMNNNDIAGVMWAQICKEHYNSILVYTGMVQYSVGFWASLKSGCV